VIVFPLPKELLIESAIHKVNREGDIVFAAYLSHTINKRVSTPVFPGRR
jgi:hypothetical protein